MNISTGVVILYNEIRRNRCILVSVAVLYTQVDCGLIDLSLCVCVSYIAVQSGAETSLQQSPLPPHLK